MQTLVIPRSRNGNALQKAALYKAVDRRVDGLLGKAVLPAKILLRHTAAALRNEIQNPQRRIRKPILHRHAVIKRVLLLPLLIDLQNKVLYVHHDFPSKYIKSPVTDSQPIISPNTDASQ